MSGVKRWASLPLSSTVTGAASRPMGKSGSANNRPLDGDTVFEIGSITKVFTALLFTDMVLRGEVAPDDPAAKFLPASVKMPDFEGAPITLLDLATYTSGLPRMPSNFAPKDPGNPYIDYTAERLYDYLSNHKLGFKPGQALRVRQSRFWSAGPHPRTACAARVTRISSSRGFARRLAWTTRASRFRVQCSSVWRAATTRVLRPSRTGTFRRLPAPARFVRRRTIC